VRQVPLPVNHEERFALGQDLLVLVLVLVLEGKRRSGLRSLHVGLVGFVTGSVLGPILYQPFEHEDEHEHDLVRQRDT
jgi:hypothetical protein